MEMFNRTSRIARKMRQSDREQKKVYKKLVIEYDDICVKIKKLDNFIGTRNFYKLITDQQDLLVKQLKAMKEYSDILDKRMKLMEKPNV